MFFLRSSAILNSFLNRRDLHFLYTLKWLEKFQSCYFFSLLRTSTPTPLLTHRYFFPLPQPFSGFPSKSNPHNEDIFLILRKPRSHNRFYIWVVTSLKSTTRQHGYNHFKSLRTAKISCGKKDIFHPVP